MSFCHFLLFHSLSVVRVFQSSSQHLCKPTCSKSCWFLSLWTCWLSIFTFVLKYLRILCSNLCVCVCNNHLTIWLNDSSFIQQWFFSIAFALLVGFVLVSWILSIKNMQRVSDTVKHWFLGSNWFWVLD